MYRGLVIRYLFIMRNREAFALIEVLSRTASVLDRRAIERRWSGPALRAALRSGAATRMLPELYAASEHTGSLLTRAHAATTWIGHGSVVIGAAAAFAWELCDAPRSITATAPCGMSRPAPDWLTLRRLLAPPPSALWHGCQVALPAMAIVTAYGHLPREQADAMIYRAVQRRLTTPEEITEAASTMYGVRGRRALGSTLASANAGSESHLETVGLRAVFNTREFSGFVRQHRLRVNGSDYRLDMFHPPTRTAIELDGATSHEGFENRTRDVRRDASLASVGILTLRFTYRDLTVRHEWCRAMVRRATAERG